MNVKKQSIRFLQDRPAEDDFFGTHAELARAVASALHTNPELRTIGLLGRWGSGKSTVLRLLEKEISAKEDLSKIHVFTFDAWEHQGEPIRRAFLESLFRFLCVHGLIDEISWRNDIETLTGRLSTVQNIETPQLTQSTRELLWSLLLVPFAISFLDLDTIKEAWGHDTTPAGIVVFWCALAMLAVPGYLLTKRLFENREEGDDALGLIINKEIKRTETKSVRSPEPTAIEFSQTCAKLVGELAANEERLLCVIDNLDRLPLSDALEIWSTIRAIFASMNFSGPCNAHPFVLVPVDHSALLATFDVQSNEASNQPSSERARSFIEKTFDLTFRVPPPVRSDWKAFLRKQLETVFGPAAVDDKSMFLIEGVLDRSHKSENDFPTPRIINRFVNSVATTWLSRQSEDFPLSIIALFVENFDDINKSVLGFTQSDQAANFDNEHPAWRDQIAALYFGVPESKSKQVLLDGPLRTSIRTHDGDAFDALMSHPGAFKVLSDVIRDTPLATTDPDSLSTIFDYAAMLGRVSGEAEGVKRTWDFLIEILAQSSALPTSDGLSKRLEAFQRHCSSSQQAKLVPVISSWLSRLASMSDDEETFAEIRTTYESWFKSGVVAKFPKLLISGEPRKVIDSIYWINRDEVLKGATLIKVRFSELAPELAKLLEDESEGVAVPAVLDFRYHFKQAFPSENAILLKPIRDAALAIMERSFSSVTSESTDSLGVMARINETSREAVDSAIDAGHLQARINEAAQAEHPDELGQLIGLAVARKKALAFDNFEIGDDTLDAFQKTLTLLAEHPALTLWDNVAFGISPKFIRRAISRFISQYPFSSEELSRISENFEFYFGPLEKADRHALAEIVGEDPKRIEMVGASKPTSLLLDFLAPLLRSGSDEADKRCQRTVISLPLETWISFIDGQDGWVIELVESCRSGIRLGVDSNAAKAVEQIVETRLSTLSHPARLRLRRLFPYMNIYAERKIIQAIMREGSSHPKEMVKLLRVLGERSSSYLSAHIPADMILPLLKALATPAEGRAWFEDHEAQIAQAINRANKQTRATIGNWIAAEKDTKPRVRGIWIEMVGKRLNLA